MIIRLTDKMVKKVGLAPKSTVEISQQPLCDWTMRPFNFGPQRYILATNTSTMFSVCFPAKGSNNSKNFLTNFAEALAESHWHYGLWDAYNQIVLPSFESVIWSKVGYNRVNGTMTEITRHAKFVLETGPLPSLQLSLELNQNIHVVNDYKASGDIYLKLAKGEDTNLPALPKLFLKSSSA